MSVKMNYAKAADGGYVRIWDVPRGLACGCSCVKCSEPVIAKQGAVLDWHFAHTAESCCDGAISHETLVHAYAVRAILLNAPGSVPEGRYGETLFRADVMRRDGRGVEVIVHNAMSEEKLEALHAMGQQWIEVPLRAELDRLWAVVSSGRPLPEVLAAFWEAVQRRATDSRPSWAAYRLREAQRASVAARAPARAAICTRPTPNPLPGASQRRARTIDTRPRAELQDREMRIAWVDGGPETVIKFRGGKVVESART